MTHEMISYEHFTLLVVQLQIHAVVNLVVAKRDMVFEDGVPLLEDDSVMFRSRLSSNQFLQITNRVILVAFYAYFLSQAIIARDFNHDCLQWVTDKCG